MRLQRVREMYDLGQSQTSIAVALSISKSTVQRCFRELGIVGSPGSKVSYTDALAAKAVMLYRAGWSMLQIEKELLIDDQAVRRILVKAGVIAATQVLRPAYPEHVRTEAIRLYVNDNMSCAKVAGRLGLKAFTVKEWVKTAGVVRSMSQAAILSIHQGKKRGRSDTHHLWQSSKTGEWHLADSTYEVVRMQQLDADETVIRWSVCRLRIPYVCPETSRRRNYVPDLDVTYSCGLRVIEEIKPAARTTEPVNMAKFAAGKNYADTAGAVFRVVTEADIGVEAIKAYQGLGFQRLNDAARQERERRMSAIRRERKRASETPEARLVRLEKDALRARKYREKLKAER